MRRHEPETVGAARDPTHSRPYASHLPSIVVGAALSLTGRFSLQGRQAQRGLTLWAEQVNRDGGLQIGAGASRHRVSLLIYDDASRRAAATALIEQLIVTDQVMLLFGPYSSVLALAAAEVAHRHGRVLWNHGGSSDAIAGRGWQRIVNLLTPASQYAAPVLQWAAGLRQEAGLPAQTLAVVRGAGGTFPAAVAAGARAEAVRLGLSVVLDATYPDADDGWPALVATLRDRRPDIVLGVGTTDADIAFARELRRQHAVAPTTALVAAPIEAFRAALADDADGFCGPSQWEPSADDRPDIGPTSSAFAAAFFAHFGVIADYPAAQAFAAGLLAAHCAEQAGTCDDAALWEAASDLNLTTCYGRFRLDRLTGQQIGHAMSLVQWQHGQKVQVGPPPTNGIVRVGPGA